MPGQLESRAFKQLKAVHAGDYVLPFMVSPSRGVKTPESKKVLLTISRETLETAIKSGKLG